MTCLNCSLGQSYAPGKPHGRLGHSYAPGKKYVLLLQLYVLILPLLILMLLILLSVFEWFRMAGIGWFSNFIRAWLQETGSVRHTYTEYPGETASCTRWRHGDNSTPAQPLKPSFRALPATAEQVQAMDARCGLSARGHWDGPVICNETGRVSARPSCGMAKGLTLMLLLLLNEIIIAKKAFITIINWKTVWLQYFNWNKLFPIMPIISNNCNYQINLYSIRINTIIQHS